MAKSNEERRIADAPPIGMLPNGELNIVPPGTRVVSRPVVIGPHGPLSASELAQLERESAPDEDDPSDLSDLNEYDHLFAPKAK